MIIQRVAELKNAGVWKDFSAPRDLCLRPRTLIYGFNGSGKTTLSRVLSSIQRGTLEERLPNGTIFKIETSDGTSVTQDLTSNPFGKNLLVFNTDFISRNFKWDASSAEGIAYLSERKVDARKEFDEIVPKLQAAGQKTKEKEQAKTGADKELKDFKAQVARSIREVAPSRTYTQSYDARKIQAHYSNSTFNPEKKLTDKELNEKQGILSQSGPLPELSYSPSLPAGFAEWFGTAQGLLKQSISTIAMEEFEAHSDALRWAEKGLRYHEERNLSDCLLCGNPFPEERRAQLRNLFDESWDAALKALQDSLVHGREYQQNLRENYKSIPQKTEVTADERGEFSENRTNIEDALTQIDLCVTELLEGLQARAANPTKVVDAADALASFNLDDWLRNYIAIEEAMGIIVTKHNAAFTNFLSIQKDAFERIEAHVLATNQSKWKELQKAISDAGAEHEEAQREETRLANRQLELSNDLRDHGVGADKMNELVWTYLGHNELRLVAKDNGYKVTRLGGESATELSEGERTAISFCYFLTQLAAEGRKVDDLVLVIDDPVSSLDTAARTHAYSLMTRMTKKCAQVVVLTHNTSFMNMVKREYQNLQRRDESREITALLSLDCRKPCNEIYRKTLIVPMHKLLVKHDSEYHYLFNFVQSAAQNQNSEYLFLLPNATRKLLEMFAAFCSPGQSNFAGALSEHHETVKDKLDVRALERLVQIKSHGTIDDLGKLPDLTLQDAVRASQASINFIKIVDKPHYEKMKRACE